VRIARLSVLAGILLSLAGAAPVASSELPISCSDEALAANIASCDIAIAAEADPQARSIMLHRRAYALVEKFKYEEALQDLDRALQLRPDFADALHERAYVHGELSEFDKALSDLDREVAIRPNWPSAYQERAFASHWTGDFARAWADRDRQVALQPGDAEVLLSRADEAIWLGRYDDATRDVAAAEALSRSSGNAKALQRAEMIRTRIVLLSARTSGGSPLDRCKAAQKNNVFDGPNLIADCTAAFLAATDNKLKAEILTIRSLLWLVQQQDPQSSTEDRRIVVALEPDNADWHSNLGFSYIEGRHSWAAEREFNRALAIRQTWIALGGRASARYNLNRKDEAFADAKKSFELHPNELALIILGDLAHDHNDDRSAKLYWMGAYRVGARGDTVMGRLKSIGIDHPEREPAQ